MSKIPLISILFLFSIGLPAGAEDGSAVKRMPDGKPDLSGTYDAHTLTPLEPAGGSSATTSI